MFGTMVAPDGDPPSLVETALHARLTQPGSRISTHRPRGLWLVELVHGHRGRGGFSGTASGATPAADAGDVGEAPAGSPVAPGNAGVPDPADSADLADAEETASRSPVEAPRASPGPVDERARLLDEGAALLDAVVEVERGLAQLAGARARALASFARCRPAAWDRQPGERGAASASSRAARAAALPGVSEWAVDEVAARLRLSGRAAWGLLVESVELVETLPATLRALEAGEISWAQARALVELLRSVSADHKALVQARVLPRAPRQTVAQLRECTRRAIAGVDADAALRRLTEAVRGRRVTRQPGEDGMAVLTAVLPAPVARACHQAVRAYAQACAVDQDGRPDPRSLDERMADCLADLILRPDAAGRSPVRVLLTVIAGMGTVTGVGPDADQPGEIDGETVPAALVRELGFALGLLPRPDGPPANEPSATATSAAGVLRRPPDTPAEDTAAEDTAAEGTAGGEDSRADPRTVTDAGEDRARTALAALLDLRRLSDTALAQRPRIAVVDQLSGCLLALTDSIELRRAARSGVGLGPPGETDGHRPSDPLDRFVRLRDRRCRFPGCRAGIRRCDLDHRVPYPHGPTAHRNLEGLCEHHHRLSHQAPGWRLEGRSDTGLVWVLPGGTTITTVPPRFGTDDGSQPTPASGPRPDTEHVDWRRLTPDQRRERIRTLICGRAPRPDDSAAPF